MDIFLKRVYVTEIKTQCQFASNAIEYLNEALKQIRPPTHLDSDQRIFLHAEVFRQIHSFLTHASNVSRLFWPSFPKQKNKENLVEYKVRLASYDKIQRANALKDLYKIDDSNILKNRALRDHLEHYDERLDDWRKTRNKRGIATDIIGPMNSIGGLSPTDMMRCFDPDQKHFIFRGETFNLQALVTAICFLLEESVILERNLISSQGS